MFYIASPYTDESEWVVEERVNQVTEFTGRLLAAGHVAFSPIVYCHDLARQFALPTDAAYWHNFNMSILRRCDALLVLQLDGWRESDGVHFEMKTANYTNIPTIFYREEYGKFKRNLCQVPVMLPPESV